MATLGMSEAEREAIERFEARRDRAVDDGARHPRFLGGMVRAVQAAVAVLDKVAADYADKGVRLAKIDVDEDKLIAAQFRIQSIPTVYAIYRGQPVADLTNYRTEAQLKKALDQLLTQLKIEPRRRDAAGRDRAADRDGRAGPGRRRRARARSPSSVRFATWRRTMPR